MPGTITDFLNVARGELGKGPYEVPGGSNRTKYGKWYGLDGNPWCAMYISWAIHFSGSSGYRFASVASSLAWAKRNGRHTGDFRPGYIACKLYTASAGHTGIVEAVHNDGTGTFLEGNTSGSDDRNGGSVQRRRRPLSFWNQGCIKPVFSGSGPPPPPPPPPPPDDRYHADDRALVDQYLKATRPAYVLDKGSPSGAIYVVADAGGYKRWVTNGGHLSNLVRRFSLPVEEWDHADIEDVPLRGPAPPNG